MNNTQNKIKMMLAATLVGTVITANTAKSDVLFTVPAVATVAGIAAYSGYQFGEQLLNGTQQHCQAVSYQSDPVCQNVEHLPEPYSRSALPDVPPPVLFSPGQNPQAGTDQLRFYR
ncbi:MAG: hypothetical protein HQL52_13155 [Magnetococcales bacterium]|nr:hypothetical protein [Magnetococcales bacterium]